MGKSKQKRRSSAKFDELPDSDDDASSVASVSTTASEDGQVFDRHHHLEDELKSELDKLFEKRTETRISALSSMISILKKDARFHFLSSNKETFIERMMSAQKRGDQESTLALHLLSMLFIQLGPDASNDIGTLIRVAKVAISDKTNAPRLRAVAAELLGVVVFAAGTNGVDDLAAIQFLEDYILDFSSVGCACLSSWCLCLSTASTSVANEMADKYIQRLVDNIQDAKATLDYQMIAGLAIVLLQELSTTDEYFAFDDIIDIFHNFATESNKSKKKKDLKEQRAHFRAMVRALEDQEKPHDTMQIKTQTLVIDSWALHCQIAAFRRFLHDGLQFHLLQNQFVRDVFGLGPVPIVDRAFQEAYKKELRSVSAENSRLRRQERQRSRDSKKLGY